MREMTNFLATLLIAVCLGVSIGSPLHGEHGLERVGRIVGGNTYEIRQVPYQVSVTRYKMHNCGGSVISQDWVLTAAHCMEGSAVQYGVRAGSDFSTEGGRLHELDHYINHERWHPMNKQVAYDISLVRVATPFVFDKLVQPVGLFHEGETVREGDLALATGWGNDEKGSSTKDLRGVLLPIIAWESCRRRYEAKGGINEGQICAGLTDGRHDVCRGDSGGPLVIDGRQAGIVSWGPECGLPNSPGVYSSVAYYREWIRERTAL